jgi:hypothetical protein
MAVQIQAIFINLPIAVARLGGSDTPMDSSSMQILPDGLRTPLLESVGLAHRRLDAGIPSG